MSGAPEPRLAVAPPSVGTYGPEATALAARAGLVLDPWQSTALDVMLSYKRDGTWACFEYAEIVARQNGKGAILEARALAGLFLLDEEEILWSAHEYKTAMVAFRRMRKYIKTLGRPIRGSDTKVQFDKYVVKISNTNGEEGFERTDTGARVKFVARSKSSGRGFSGDCIIVDESFALTDEQKEALMPTVSAKPNGQIAYTSTPPLTGDTGGTLYSLRERAEAGGDDWLGYRDWSAPGDLDDLGAVALDDRALWRTTNPAHGIRITENDIARERASMTDRGFARERLGVWPRRLRRAGGGIDPVRWAQLEDPDSKREGDIGLAVDISPLRDYAAIGLYGLRGDELGHVQLVDYRPGTGWLIGRILELRTLDPIAIAMGRGTYDSLETDLAKEGLTVPADPDEPRRGDLYVLAGSETAAACGQMIDAVRDGTIRHTGQAPLTAAVEGAQLRQTGDVVAWSRTSPEVDISPIVVGTYARYAYGQRAHIVADEYDPIANIG